MGLFQRFLHRVDRDGWWTTLTFFPFFLLSVILYISDSVSDVLLAIRYIKEGDLWWGGFTVAFIVIPWIFAIVLTLREFRR